MFHLTLPAKKPTQSVRKVPMSAKKVPQVLKKSPLLITSPQTCPNEAIVWAAERMCLSYEQLKASLTAEEMAGVKFAYESWEERTKGSERYE